MKLGFRRQGVVSLDYFRPSPLLTNWWLDFSKTLKVVQDHASISASDGGEIKKFYAELKATLTPTSRDFNANLGLWRESQKVHWQMRYSRAK